MHVITEVRSEPGDLYQLTGDVNRTFGHGVPEDNHGLRVTLTFRLVTHSFVHPVKHYFRDAKGKRAALPNAHSAEEGDEASESARLDAP